MNDAIPEFDSTAYDACIAKTLEKNPPIEGYFVLNQDETTFDLKLKAKDADCNYIKARSYRQHEHNNDIEITDSSVSARPDDQLLADADIVQTFTVTYKKPFKANGLTDINMKPLKYYNLTSAYGCYTNSKKDNVIT